MGECKFANSSLSELDLLLEKSRLGVGGGTSNAVGLNGKIVLVHGHVEEAEVTPVGAPRVAANPVTLASSGIFTVANDRDLVVDHGEEHLLRVDVVALSFGNTNVGSLKVVSRMDTTRDGTVLVEFSHHLVLALDLVVLADIVLLVLNSSAVVEALIALGIRRPGAVTADINVFTIASLEVVSSVLLARRVRNTSPARIPVHEARVATIARATSLAIDDDLGVESNRGCSKITIKDVKSVSNGRSGALGPAGTAVARDMLILVPRQVVLSIHVPPVSDVREVILSNHIPSVGREFDLGTVEVCLSNTAATSRGGILKGVLRVSRFVSWLREIVNGVIVLGIVLLFIGRLMPNLFRYILRSSPVTVALNGNVVGATANANKAFLAPVGTPAVTDEPVVLAILNTVADNADYMNNVHIASIIAVDAASVSLEGVRYCDIASNRATLSDFLLHGFLARDGSVFVNTINEVLIGDEASLAWVAVAADVHGRTVLSIVVAAGPVDGAGLVSNLILVHPLVCVVSIATMATLVSLLTGDDDLRSNVDVGPSRIAGDLDAVRES